MSDANQRRIAVVAVGGNSLIKDSSHQTIPDQYQAGVETMAHIAGMIEQGWDVVLTHGNRPQVGFILRRSELSATCFSVPSIVSFENGGSRSSRQR